MSQPFRLASGGRIDRARPLRFTFDGRGYEGYAGDTLASALLANGVRVTGRSFKYHRPRGIVAAGLDEAGTLVQLGTGARTEPNLKATEVELHDGLVARAVNAWPSARFDALAWVQWLKPLMPAGFYYKTFMAPRWSWYEPAIRRLAGLGASPVEADPDVYDKRHASCDVLVVGAGASGEAAAREAGASGAQVLWVDAGRDVPDLRLSNVTAAPGTLVFGCYDHNHVLAVERPIAAMGRSHSPRQRLWKIRARRIVFATGAFERPLLFPGNDRPGVMLAGAALHYLEQHAVLPGRRVVRATNNDSTDAVARALQRAGVENAAVAHVRAGTAPTDTRGAHGLRAVELHDVDADGKARPGTGRWVEADALLTSGGWQPAVHLFSQAGGTLRFDPQLAAFLPDRVPVGVGIVGAAAGEGCGSGPRPRSVAPPCEIDVTPLRRPAGRTWVDLLADVTSDDLRLAVRENFRAIEHVKRYTTTGMMPDQGKASNVSAVGIVAAATGVTAAALGTTKFRPPFSPVTFGAIAGRHLGANYRPLKRLAADAGHAALGAQFEEYGGWLRPAWYRSNGAGEAAAIEREVRAVRAGAGLFDASPLGKILVQGPDAAEFLNRMYVNNLLTLKPGQCRYGLMLSEDGIVKDDGICTRLADDRFLVGTTSGGAERIADWLEEWLQGEWPTLDVAIEPVTTQWATVCVTGPAARAVVDALATGVDLAAFPHMSLREAQWRGVPARILRVSYSGERSYEISVPARHGAALWGAALAAGRASGIVAFGVEAMLRLRLEKGFLLVGVDTDGMTLPQDVGFGEIAAKKRADFVGKRSALTPEGRRAGRRQFVGIESVDGRTVLPVGAHLIAAGATTGPSQGWVTSSMHSHAAGRPVALGMVENGSARIGETLVAYDAGRCVPVRLCGPCAYDPAGARLHD